MRNAKKMIAEGKCMICSGEVKRPAEFNDLLLCPTCFNKEITSYMEGRKYKATAATA